MGTWVSFLYPAWINRLTDSLFFKQVDNNEGNISPNILTVQRQNGRVWTQARG